MQLLGRQHFNDASDGKIKNHATMLTRQAFLKALASEFLDVFSV